MRSIILAAGEGTRLRPYTNEIPKCMVQLANKTLLQHQLNVISMCGISDITVVAGYCAERIIAQNAKILVNQNYKKTNMVETLFYALNQCDNEEDIIVSYGDIIYEQHVLDSLINSNDPLNVVVDKEWEKLWRLRMDDPLDDAETLKLEDTTRIRELGKKPKNPSDIQGQYIGLFKIKANKIDELKRIRSTLDRNKTYDGKDFDNMYMTSFIQILINLNVEVRAVFTANGWLEVDTVEDLILYKNLFRKNELSQLINL